ncbi:hypothetical protein HQO24_10240 [Rhodococcus fascians]|nr:hypothetical protein [Rhodococcus fascians]MBY4396941.1 hypothetical protein [Rhodococcus fascians]MBY4407420.1 hypothetical protein [Rhodococcus fascians]MBY4421451.1 hypothetical protein [Rhodococcus fascians]MBY4460796.1 hypothetical protein [Rhodococcus fascians]
MRETRTESVTFYAEPQTILGEEYSAKPTISTGLAYSSHGDEVLLSVYDSYERAELMLTREEAKLLGEQLLRDSTEPNAAESKLAIVRNIKGGAE